MIGTMKNRIVRALSPTGSRARTYVAVALTVLAAGACDVHGVSEPGALASITVTPNTTLAGLSTQQMVAIGYDGEGRVVQISPAWSIAAGGGTVNSAGLFSAGTVTGLFANTVVASVGSISGRASITVTLGALASLTVTPSPTTLTVGATQQFVAVGKDAAGNTVPTTLEWSVVAGGGTITSAGLFTAGTIPGTFATTVRVGSGSLSTAATVIVTAGVLANVTVTPSPVTVVNGTAQQFTAVGRDAFGNIVAIAPAWTLVAGGGTIGVASGLFTAGTAIGTFTNTVRASVGSLSGSATVNVISGALTTLTLTPNPVSLQTNGTQQYTAVGNDANGNPVVTTPVWSVVNGGGSITSAGLFTAGMTPGTYANTVRAVSGGITASATVNITAGALATITVTPSSASMIGGSTQQFTAVGQDAGGNIIAIAPIWTIVAGGGTIGASSGLLTAGTTVGTYTNTVRASVGSLAGFATVTVTSGALTSITVTPNPVSLQTNGSQLFTAVGTDAGGNVFVITPTWSVVNGGGSINAGTGNFTAGGTTGTFTNTVRATIGTVSGFATVTVTSTSSVLTTITVSPNPVSMLANGTQQFSAIGRDGSGNLFPFAPVWAVVSGGGSINSSTGLFTAGAVAGTYNNTIRASSGQVSGTATVTVTASQGGAPIANLGSAAPNGIMAGQSVTCVTGGIINADVSVSPGNTLTGFGPCVITGTRNLGNAIAAQGQIDLTTAYNTLFGLPCPPANAVVANLGGTTKPAGVYCSASSIGVTGTLTLNGGGDPNATFVFQAGSSLITAGSIVLTNGAQAKNVWWVVGTSATLGTASQWQGNIVALTSITLVDNATLFGRALARNGSVTLGTNNVIILP